MNENGKDIDQQAVFDRLPLTAEQRKKLYAVITGAEQQKDSAIPVGNFEAHDFPVPLDSALSHPTDSPSLQTH